MSLLAFVGSAAASRESSPSVSVSLSVSSLLAAVGVAGYRGLSEVLVASDIAITKTVEAGGGPVFPARTLNAWSLTGGRRSLPSLSGVHLARRAYGGTANNTRGFAVHYGLDWGDRFARRPQVECQSTLVAAGTSARLKVVGVEESALVAVNSILLKEDGDYILAENGDTLFCG